MDLMFMIGDGVGGGIEYLGEPDARPENPAASFVRMGNRPRPSSWALESSITEIVKGFLVKRLFRPHTANVLQSFQK
jgi:hypothetical protein